MSGFVSGLLTDLGVGILEDEANDFASEHFQPTKDPFYEKLPNGKQVRRRLPDYCTKQESKAWKNLQNKAWSHDRSLCGCCCWTECVGWAPVLAIVPVIGPALMYWVHGKLVDYANKQYNLPAELLVKLHGNIGIDLAISLIPILGVLFAWLHASSTRNCALIYNYVSKRALEKAEMQKRAEMQAQRNAQVQQTYQEQTRAYNQRQQHQQYQQNQYQQHQQYQQNHNQQVRPPPPAYPQGSRAQRPYI